MDLRRLLQERKIAIVKSWFDAVTEAYPDDTSRFLKKRKDQFTNPVGYTISDGLEHLFDALLQGMLEDKVSAFLDSIIRIRAVQDFTPSEAVAFIFRLKKVIRQELGDDILKQQGVPEELSTFDSAIDDLALYAFDIYMKCREKIYELKANEARNMTFRLLQKAKLIEQNKE
jgi:hypothetical protein